MLNELQNLGQPPEEVMSQVGSGLSLPLLCVDDLERCSCEIVPQEATEGAESFEAGFGVLSSQNELLSMPPQIAPPYIIRTIYL